MCIPCAQAGARDPNFDPKIAVAESDIFWGRAMMAGAVVLIIVLIFVPSREGASPSSTIYLWGAALTFLGAGFKKADAAGKELERLKRRPIQPPETTRGK